MPGFKDSCVISLTIKCYRFISGTKIVIGWGKHPCSCHFCIYKWAGFHRNSQFKYILKILFFWKGACIDTKTYQGMLLLWSLVEALYNRVSSSSETLYIKPPSHYAILSANSVSADEIALVCMDPPT